LVKFGNKQKYGDKDAINFDDIILKQQD